MSIGRKCGLALVVAGIAAGCVPMSAAAGSSPVAAKSSAGAGGPTLVETVWLSRDMVDHRFRTPSLGVTPWVRVLLPPGYRRSARRYPVLYLLHGGIDDYRSLTEKGRVDRLPQRAGMILVMPDTGPLNGYTNWATPPADGPRNWRDFHLGQLIGWVDRHYRTTARRSGRAIAGISMGGGGALRYAARRPDLFTAAASLSGAVDYRDPALRAVTGDVVYGPWETNQVFWRGDNPFDLAVNLGSLRVALHSGNGRPATEGGPFDPIEIVVHRMSEGLHEELNRLGIRHVWHDYGEAGHNWGEWVPELAETIAWSRRAFAKPRRRPRRFSYRAIEPAYRAFGWRVKLKRRAPEFSRLNLLGPHRLTITGSGWARVCTPPRFARGRVFRLRIRDRRGLRAGRVRAAGRRLCFVLHLGPANPFPQFSPGRTTKVFAARAGFRPRTGFDPANGRSPADSD